MIFLLQAFAICFLVYFFISKVGMRKFGKALFCVMMVMALGPLGLIFAYFFWTNQIKGK